MRILIRQGEGAAGITRIYADLLTARNEYERTLRIVLTAPDLDANKITRATAGGDEHKLRGIPAIGRGVSGAIPGTKPGNNLT